MALLISLSTPEQALREQHLNVAMWLSFFVGNIEHLCTESYGKQVPFWIPYSRFCDALYPQLLRNKVNTVDYHYIYF
jgi:hypothetical protein